jgi:SOS-response transcriptional repressor LexA
MDFWETVRAQVKKKGTKLEAAAEAAGISSNTLSGWSSKGRLPRADEAASLARVLGTTVEFLVSGEDALVSNAHAHSPSGKEVAFGGDTVPVPIYSQKVAAGKGKEILDSAEVVGKLPFLAKMLRGIDPLKACAVEATGDSMTGIGLFGGDQVVFVPGLVDTEGVYVIRVDDKLLVKRIQFKQDENKVLVISENKSYAVMMFPADSERLELVGKVLGWVHAHPY